MTALDASLALAAVGPGVLRARADPAYEANTGMFGGWTAALLLKSVVDDPQADGSASALTVSYISRTPPGSALTLRPERIGGGRSIAHWRSLLFVDGEAAPVAAAAIVLSNRRESVGFNERKMPPAPAPDTLADVRPPASFGQSTAVRYAIGGVPFNQPTTRSLAWQREMSGRRIDAVGLAYLSDVGWPRVFATGSAPRASSTITMSVYFHATGAELDDVGDDWVLCDMIGTRIESSTVGSKADLWSKDGKLLATTEQLCWFR